MVKRQPTSAESYRTTVHHGEAAEGSYDLTRHVPLTLRTEVRCSDVNTHFSINDDSAGERSNVIDMLTLTIIHGSTTQQIMK